jgi:hypothetical protein
MPDWDNIKKLLGEAFTTGNTYPKDAPNSPVEMGGGLANTYQQMANRQDKNAPIEMGTSGLAHLAPMGGPLAGLAAMHGNSEGDVPGRYANTVQAKIPDWVLTALTNPKRDEATEAKLQDFRSDFFKKQNDRDQVLERGLQSRLNPIREQNLERFNNAKTALPLADPGHALVRTPTSSDGTHKYDLITPDNRVPSWITLQPDSAGVPSVQYLDALPKELKGNALAAQAYTQLAKNYGALRSDMSGATSPAIRGAFWDKFGTKFNDPNSNYMPQRYESAFDNPMSDKEKQVLDLGNKLQDKYRDERGVVNEIPSSVHPAIQDIPEWYQTGYPESRPINGILPGEQRPYTQADTQNPNTYNLDESTPGEDWESRLEATQKNSPSQQYTKRYKEVNPPQLQPDINNEPGELPKTYIEMNPDHPDTKDLESKFHDLKTAMDSQRYMTLDTWNKAIDFKDVIDDHFTNTGADGIISNGKLFDKNGIQTPIDYTAFPQKGNSAVSPEDE